MVAICHRVCFDSFLETVSQPSTRASGREYGSGTSGNYIGYLSWDWDSKVTPSAGLGTGSLIQTWRQIAVMSPVIDTNESLRCNGTRCVGIDIPGRREDRIEGRGVVPNSTPGRGLKAFTSVCARERTLTV